MDWSIVINAGITFLLGGGVMMWVTLRDKKRQESEKTAQAHEATRQEEIETDVKKFEYLERRTVFAEQHIEKLHQQMKGVQKTLNKFIKRTIYAETHICLNTDCPNRKPALGTYAAPKCNNEEEIKDENESKRY